jgi:DNA-nicking Smr family endonuclease
LQTNSIRFRSKDGLDMTKDHRSVFNKPFEGLKHMLERKARQEPKSEPEAAVQRRSKAPSSREVEKRLFDEAMTGVTPIRRGNCVERGARLRNDDDRALPEEEEALRALERLVREGKGFVVSQTAEYVEGRFARSHPELTRRLHRGDFTIQDHLDLHGMRVQEAQSSVERFLKQSIEAGKHAVLIVHGRGLSSPHKPILKTKVCEWLSSGYWRKWVVAFTSARLCDGGSGATYVLLRRRPVSKRDCKGFKSSKS